jgi:hypothetical protein
MTHELGFEVCGLHFSIRGSSDESGMSHGNGARMCGTEA